MLEYKTKFNARDDLARRRMVELMYDPVRNPLKRVFSALVEEGGDEASV